MLKPSNPSELLGIKERGIVRLSTKGRYGMRAMLALARRYGEGPVPLKEVAETESLSESYLEQL